MSALADRLRSSLEKVPAERVLAGDDLNHGEFGDHHEAAVLIAITDREEPGVILTVRREHLRAHAGQVAFPGGRIDEGESAIEAAVREAWEELALDPAKVELVGTIDAYRTITNYRVVPVIGVIPPDLALEPHEPEVADWFEVPLGFLLDPANQRRQSALFRGRARTYYEIEWNGHRIWGATAAMIVNLSARLQWH